MMFSIRADRGFYTVACFTNLVGDSFNRWYPLINLHGEGDAFLFREMVRRLDNLSRIKMLINGYRADRVYELVTGRGLTMRPYVR